MTQPKPKTFLQKRVQLEVDTQGFSVVHMVRGVKGDFADCENIAQPGSNRCTLHAVGEEASAA